MALDSTVLRCEQGPEQRFDGAIAPIPAELVRDLSQPIVTLYGRAGCHLCTDARVLLDRLAPSLGFTTDEVDVDADAELLARFDAVVPVVAIGEQEMARPPIDGAVLRRRLEVALHGR